MKNMFTQRLNIPYLVFSIFVLTWHFLRPAVWYTSGFIVVSRVCVLTSHDFRC